MRVRVPNGLAFPDLSGAAHFLPLVIVSFRALAAATALLVIFTFEVCGFLACATPFFLATAVTFFLADRITRFRVATGNVFLASAVTAFLPFAFFFTLLVSSTARGADGVR